MTDPAKFQQRRTTIEAMRWEDGSTERAEEIIVWITEHGGNAQLRSDNGAIVIYPGPGNRKALPGDWIVRGITAHNEGFWPTPDHEFHLFFESAEDSDGRQ